MTVGEPGAAGGLLPLTAANACRLHHWAWAKEPYKGCTLVAPSTAPQVCTCVWVLPGYPGTPHCCTYWAQSQCCIHHIWHSSPCGGFPVAFGHNAPLFFPNGRFASWCLATLFFFLGLALLLFHHIRCDSVCLMYTCMFSGRLFSTWHSVLRIIKDNSVLPLRAFNLFVPDLLPCHVISFIRGMKWVSACAVWEQRGNSDSSSPSPSCTNSCKRIIKARGTRMEP